MSFFQFLLQCSLALLVVGLTMAADQSPDPIAKVPSHFAKLNDLKVHYKRMGTGDAALVFVHGWTCDMLFWNGQVPAFEGKTPVLLIDLPGHGKSDKPEMDYTMDLFAKAVDAVMKDAGVKEAVLVGHSMGTPVVRQFSRLFPTKTRGLIAVDGSLRPFSKPEQLAPFIAQLGGQESQTVRGRMIDSMFVDATTADMRKKIKDTMLAAPTYVAASAMKGIGDPAIWNDDEIKVPLQVIVTKHPMWSGEYEAYVRKLAPKVDYRVVDGAGHFLMMEKPAQVNEMIMEFVKKVGLVK